jgi:hypothetical protein
MSYICDVYIKDNKPIPLIPTEFSYTGEPVASYHAPFQIKTPIQILHYCTIKPDKNGIAVIYVPKMNNEEFYKKKKIIKSLQHPFEDINFTIYKDRQGFGAHVPLTFLELDTQYKDHKSPSWKAPEMKGRFAFFHSIRIHYTNKINNTNPLVEEYPIINLVNLHVPGSQGSVGYAATEMRNGKLVKPPPTLGQRVFGLFGKSNGGRRKTHKKHKTKQTRRRRL